MAAYYYGSRSNSRSDRASRASRAPRSFRSVALLTISLATAGLITGSIPSYAAPAYAAPAYAAPAYAVPAEAGVPHSQKDKAPMTTGFLTKTIKQGEEEYRYVVYVPAGYDGSKAFPTIVFLNGAGECGRDGLKHVAVGLAPAIMKAVDKWPFLVVFPQKPDVSKNWEDYDSLVMAMLETTRKDYQVDSHRIYLTGLSQGGHGTWAIGSRHTDLFAALAPICGWGSAEWASTLKTLPIWAFHGEADSVVPVKSTHDMVDAVKTAGGDVKLTTYPGVGHNSWDNAYSKGELADWFLQHTKK